jgi:Spy/CpxP family protein refolding chaperone
MKKATLVTLATVAAGAAGFVLLSGFAGGCGHHPRDPAEVTAAVTAHVDDVLDDLKTTDAQRQQILAVKDRMLAKGLALRQAGQPLHEELLAQWNSPNPDRARLHALVDQQLDAMRAFAHDAVDAGVEVHDTLTPEQRAQVTKKAERMRRWAR